MKKRLIFVLGSVFILVMAAMLFSVNTGAATEEYGLYIGGKQVTSSNLSGRAGGSSRTPVRWF